MGRPRIRPRARGRDGGGRVSGACAATLEVPVDSIEAVELAAPCADRIELCDDLATEGWTPTAALVRAARAVSDVQRPGHRPRIVAMIRPRLPESTLALDAAAFVATGRVVAASLREIAACIDAGAHEIAIGLLDAHGRIDVAACAQLRDAALSRGATVAFLRVFDLLADRSRGWDDIARLGVGRVLTAGVLGWDARVAPVEARTEVISADAACAARACASIGRQQPSRAVSGPGHGLAAHVAPHTVAIAAGGGVRASNADQFVRVTPHLHASCRVGGRISADELAALRACIHGSRG